jgi:hypothetical protein
LIFWRICLKRRIILLGFKQQQKELTIMFKNYVIEAALTLLCEIAKEKEHIHRTSTTTRQYIKEVLFDRLGKSNFVTLTQDDCCAIWEIVLGKDLLPEAANADILEQAKQTYQAAVYIALDTNRMRSMYNVPKVNDEASLIPLPPHWHVVEVCADAGMRLQYSPPIIVMPDEKVIAEALRCLSLLVSSTGDPCDKLALTIDPHMSKDECLATAREMMKKVDDNDKMTYKVE